MTICLLYHISGYKDFKGFYRQLSSYLKLYFPRLPSYCRFLILERRTMFLLLVFIQRHFGKETQIYYIDSIYHYQYVRIKEYINIKPLRI